jgi:hypothetical protein
MPHYRGTFQIYAFFPSEKTRERNSCEKVTETKQAPGGGATGRPIGT